MIAFVPFPYKLRGLDFVWTDPEAHHEQHSTPPPTTPPQLSHASATAQNFTTSITPTAQFAFTDNTPRRPNLQSCHPKKIAPVAPAANKMAYAAFAILLLAAGAGVVATRRMISQRERNVMRMKGEHKDKENEK